MNTAHHNRSAPIWSNLPNTRRSVRCERCAPLRSRPRRTGRTACPLADGARRLRLTLDVGWCVTVVQPRHDERTPPPLLADLDCAVRGTNPFLRVCLGSSVMISPPRPGSTRHGPTSPRAGPSARRCGGTAELPRWEMRARPGRQRNWPASSTGASAFSHEALAAGFGIRERDLPQFPFTPIDPLIVARRNLVNPVP